MKLERLSGLQHLLTTDEVVVGMVEYKGRIIIACSDGVYELVDDGIEQLAFEPACTCGTDSTAVCPVHPLYDLGSTAA